MHRTLMKHRPTEYAAEICAKKSLKVVAAQVTCVILSTLQSAGDLCYTDARCRYDNALYFGDETSYFKRIPTMTDPETPAFHVVDRRSCAADRTAPRMPCLRKLPLVSAADVPADTSSPTRNVNPAASRRRLTDPTVSTDPYSIRRPIRSRRGCVRQRTGGDDMPMPDPAALLAYVAMQMDVKALAGTLLGVFPGRRGARWD